MSRALKNKIITMILRFSTVICCTLLLSILFIIFLKGKESFTWDFLSTGSKDFGVKGGIFYNIVGSTILLMGCSLISLPLALSTAIFKSEYIKHQFMKRLVDVILLALNGVPSLIYGLFGLIFFVYYLNFGISWVVGSLILGLMIIPTITLSVFQSINSIPSAYRESAFSLGLTKWQVIVHVILPKALQGALTGLLLGMSRALGETAPIMFTATVFSGIEIPEAINDPVVSLPTHILYLSQQAINAKALSNAWGASLVLVIIVLILNSTSFLFRNNRKSKQTYA